MLDGLNYSVSYCLAIMFDIFELIVCIKHYFLYPMLKYFATSIGFFKVNTSYKFSPVPELLLATFKSIARRSFLLFWSYYSWSFFPHHESFFS